MRFTIPIERCLSFVTAKGQFEFLAYILFEHAGGKNMFVAMGRHQILDEDERLCFSGLGRAALMDKMVDPILAEARWDPGRVCERQGGIVTGGDC